MATSRLTVTTDWVTVLDRWLSLIQIEAGTQLDPAIIDAATEVVETLHVRRRGLRGSLRRLGNALGELGWPLDELHAWIAVLCPLTSRSRRKQLQRFESISALTEGWAERYVRSAQAGACIDAVTGLGTPTVLRMRLKEIYQQCRGFGISPAEAFCFIVVDCNTDDLAPFERDAVMVTTAGMVADVFHKGETLIRHRSRVIVLATNSDSTRNRAAVLGRVLHDAPLTGPVTPMVWHDELPATTLDLDRQLRELVGDPPSYAPTR
jgi:hypothetical protein